MNKIASGRPDLALVPHWSTRHIASLRKVSFVTSDVLSAGTGFDLIGVGKETAASRIASRSRKKMFSKKSTSQVPG